MTTKPYGGVIPRGERLGYPEAGMSTGEKLVVLATLAGLAGLAYASARADNEATNRFLRQKWGEISGQVSTYAQEIWQQMQRYSPSNPENQWYGTALTPTQLVEYVEEKATPSPLPSPSPTATKTPEPTATPTPEPTPTPEAIHTPEETLISDTESKEFSLEDVISKIDAKLQQERVEENVRFRVPMYEGKYAGRNLMAKLTVEMLKFLGIGEVNELLKRGYDVYVLWEGRNWEIYTKNGLSRRTSKAKICVVFQSESFVSFEGPSFLVLSEIAEVKAIDQGGKIFLQGGGVNRFTTPNDVLGATWTSAQGVTVDWRGDNKIVIGVFDLENELVYQSPVLRIVSINGWDASRPLELRHFNLFAQVSVEPVDTSLNIGALCK